MESVEIERLGLKGLSSDLLRHLEGLYRQAYHDSRMYESLLSDTERRPEIFQLFVARPAGSEEIVGAIAIEHQDDPAVDYHGLYPVFCKRFCVVPTLRGEGLGRRLLKESIGYCFADLGLRAVFGVSNEIGALSLHGREGARFLLPTVERISDKNSPTENVKFFKEFLTNPKFRLYRLPGGTGVRIVYCADPMTPAFRAAGYVTQRELLEC